MKHTTGNWYYEKSGIHIGGNPIYDRYIIATDENQAGMRSVIGFCNTPQEHSRFVDETESNAKLMAAAPELLEALQNAYKCSGEKNYLTKPVLDNMKQVIEKATL